MRLIVALICLSLASVGVANALIHGSTSVPIVTITLGSPSEPVSNQIQADTFYNCTSNNGTTYVTSDDTHAWGNAGASNMLIGGFTSLSPLTGTNVNQWTGYGSFSTADGTDGPGGTARSNKVYGLFCLGGNIYALAARQCRDSTCTATALYPQGAASPIKSTDHGATWANFQAPSSPTSTGTEPTPLGSLFFSADSVMAAPSFVMYGADGDPVPPVDNAGTYVYIVSNDGFWDNGNELYLARVLRSALPNLSPSDYQFYTGGDGTLSGNWSSSFSNAAIILQATGQMSAPSMQYIPSVGRYLLLEWYYPAPLTTSQTVWTFWESPHPWGPFHQVFAQSWSPQGFYNPTILVPSVNNSRPNGTPVTIMFSGDYSTCCHSGGYYHLFTTTLQYNTH